MTSNISEMNNALNDAIRNIDLTASEHDFSFVGAAISSDSRIDMQNAIGRYTARIEPVADKLLAVSTGIDLMKNAAGESKKILAILKRLPETANGMPSRIRNSNCFGKNLAEAMANKISNTVFQNDQPSAANVPWVEASPLSESTSRITSATRENPSHTVQQDTNEANVTSDPIAEPVVDEAFLSDTFLREYISTLIAR